MSSNEKRLEQINNIILDIASGNLSGKVDVSSEFDEIDAIASGINRLGEELRATMIDRNYFDSVLKSIGDILVIFDSQFKINQINSKALELLGYQETELLGKGLNFLFKQEGDALEFKDLLFDKGKIYNKESHFLLAGGEDLPVTVSVSEISAAGENAKGYVLLAKDLKQFYIFSDALKKKNKELETFVYKVSHDLKGPVASVIGLLDLVVNGSEEDRVLYLDMMKQSLQKLDKSIVSLLNFTLANKTDLNVTNIPLKKLTCDILDSLQAFPGRSEVDFKLDIEDSLLVTTVPELLTSILQNFLENAIKYRNSSTSSTVKITTHKVQKAVNICIKDNGLGMSSQVRDRAFDMYFRGENKTPGSGLGLYITKNNIEKIGGHVELKSEEGEGTEVLLTIPNLTR